MVRVLQNKAWHGLKLLYTKHLLLHDFFIFRLASLLWKAKEKSKEMFN